MDATPVSDRSLRVLFLCTYFPKPGNSLMGVWAMDQAQGLARLGIDLSVVSFTSWVPKVAASFGHARHWADCPPEHHWGSVRAQYPRWLFYQVGPLKRLHHRRPAGPLWLGWQTARKAVARAVEAHRPDVVFAHHTAVNGYLAWQIHRRWNIPYVLNDYDFDEITDCARYPARRRLFARVLADCSLWLGASDRMRDDLIRLFPNVRAYTSHNGTHPLPEVLWQQPRPPEIQDRLVILSAGVFYGRKGIPLLVEAFSRITAKYPTAVLRLVGDGPKKPAIVEAIRKHGLQDRVQLVGFVPHDRLNQEMVWADCFALVGWDEPFATVFLEAASAGKAIVWANDGGINDVLRDGVHGIAVPPRDIAAAADALDRLLADEAFRRRAGEASRQLWASQLTWEANCRSIVGLFRQAATHSSPPQSPAPVAG